MSDWHTLERVGISYSDAVALRALARYGDHISDPWAQAGAVVLRRIIPGLDSLSNPTPYGLGDDADAEDATARRIAAWLNRFYDGLDGAKEAYKEAVSDMAIDIANSEWRRDG